MTKKQKKKSESDFPWPKISIAYDGAYPNLCSGNLVVTIDGEIFTFSGYCLRSGGCVSFDEDWDEHVSDGPWSINDEDWPDGIPKKLRRLVIDKINEQIPHGCCGGCV